MTKKTMGLTTSTPLGEAKAETAEVREENSQLKAEKENLETTLEIYEETVNNLIGQLDPLKKSIGSQRKRASNCKQ